MQEDNNALPFMTEAELFKDAWMHELMLDGLDNVYCEQLGNKLCEMGASGTPWRNAAESVGLPLDAALALAQYAAVREKLLAKPLQLFEAQGGRYEPGQLDDLARQRQDLLNQLQRQVAPRMGPVGLRRLMGFYRRWSYGLSSGLDECLLKVQQLAFDKKRSPMLLKLWLTVFTGAFFNAAPPKAPKKSSPNDATATQNGEAAPDNPATTPALQAFERARDHLAANPPERSPLLGEHFPPNVPVEWVDTDLGDDDFNTTDGHTPPWPGEDPPPGSRWAS